MSSSTSAACVVSIEVSVIDDKTMPLSRWRVIVCLDVRTTLVLEERGWRVDWSDREGGRTMEADDPEWIVVAGSSPCWLVIGALIGALTRGFLFKAYASRIEVMAIIAVRNASSPRPWSDALSPKAISKNDAGACGSMRPRARGLVVKETVQRGNRLTEEQGESEYRLSECVQVE